MKLICIVDKKRSGKDTIAEIISDNTTSVSYALADPVKQALTHAYNQKNLNNSSGVNLTISNFYGKDYEGNDYDRESPVNISNQDAVSLFLCAIEYLMRVHNLSVYNGKTNKLSGNEYVHHIEHLVSQYSDFWSVRKFMQMLGTDIVVNLCDEQFWNRCMFNEFLNEIDSSKDYFIISDIRQDHEIELMRSIGAKIIFVERPLNNSISDGHITEKGLEPLADDIVIINDGTIEDLKQKLKDLSII